jgi:hypothetical protein
MRHRNSNQHLAFSIQPAQRFGAVSTGILPSQDIEKPSAAGSKNKLTPALIGNSQIAPTKRGEQPLKARRFSSAFAGRGPLVTDLQ